MGEADVEGSPPVLRSIDHGRYAGGCVAAGGPELRWGEEQRVGNVRPAQVGFTQVGADQIGPGEVLVAQVRPDEQRAPQIRPAEVTTAEVLAHEVTVSEVTVSEVGTAGRPRRRHAASRRRPPQDG